MFLFRSHVRGQPSVPPSNLKWHPYRDVVRDNSVDVENVGELYDEDVPVWHARLLEHGPATQESDRLRFWNWSVFV